MKNLLFIVVTAYSLCACSAKPERLRYSVDNCDFCKMKLADDRFGGELVTSKGKVFKFDDIKCMTSFMHSQDNQANKYAFELVVDYAHAADEFDLVPASDAFFVSSPEVKSPMTGNIAAFKNQTAQADYLKKWNGTSLSWVEVKEIAK